MDSLSTEEFTSWKAYYAVEPWGSGFAMLATLIANAMRDAKQRPYPFDIRDFMPIYSKEALLNERMRETAEKMMRNFGK